MNLTSCENYLVWWKADQLLSGPSLHLLYPYNYLVKLYFRKHRFRLHRAKPTCRSSTTRAYQSSAALSNE